MGSSFEQLVFEIITRDKGASEAWDKYRRSIDANSKSIDQNSKAVDANSKATDKNKDSQRSWLGALAGAGLAFAPITAGAAAAGIGITAFGALAAPSVKKVADALSAKGGLGTAWDTLDGRQKNAALSVQALGQDYSALAKQMEPQVFQVFNQGLSIANSLLKPTGDLARTSGQGISDFLAQFGQDSGLNHFITYLSTIARPAIGLLGSDITHMAHAVFSLLQGFGGTGLAELRLVTDALTGLDNVVSFLSRDVPVLGNVAVTIGGLALAMSKLGVLSSVLKLTGLSTAATEIGLAAAATTDLTIAERAAIVTTTALNAISPWAWAALGVGALGALIVSLHGVKSGTDDALAAISQKDNASGFNIAGWQKLADQTRNVATQQQHLIDTSSALGHQMSIAKATQDQYSASSQHAANVANTLNSFLSVLEAKYHVTRDRAITLAESSGKLLDKQGRLTLGFGASVTKVEAWADRENNATGTTNLLAIAVGALTTELDKNVTAILTLQGDQLAWQSAMVSARTQLDSNSAGLRGNTADAIANRQAVLSTTETAAAFARAQLNTKGNLAGASREIQQQITFLQGLHDKTKFTSTEIAVLVGLLHDIKSEQAVITVAGTGHWQVTQDPGGPRIHVPGTAKGALITGGTPGRDSVLINAMPGELVVPTNLVQSGAVDHLRGRIPGFADGGVVGSFKGSVPGLGGFLRTEDAATVKAIEVAVAAATFAGIEQAQATSIGGLVSGNAIVDFASQFVGKLAYVWGGTSLTTGADCAGFTEEVYRHFGLIIPRTSEAQFAFMQQVSDRPGALAFFVSPAGGPPPGHVGISDGHGMMVNAAGTQFGTIVSSTAGNMGFGIPPNPLTGNRGPHGLPPGIRSFDQGGYLEPGLTLAYNGTGRPEPVGGGTTVINITINVPPTVNPRDAGRQVADMLTAHIKAGGRLYPQGVTPR